jgi:hypothetical protein
MTARSTNLSASQGGHRACQAVHPVVLLVVLPEVLLVEASEVVQPFLGVRSAVVLYFSKTVAWVNMLEIMAISRKGKK